MALNISAYLCRFLIFDGLRGLIRLLVSADSFCVQIWKHSHDRFMGLAALSGSDIRRQSDVIFLPLQHFRQDIVPARQCCRSRSACSGLFQRTTALLSASSVSGPSICIHWTIQLCLCRVMVNTSSTSIVGRQTQRLLPVGNAHATKNRVVAIGCSAHCAANRAMHSL